MTLNIHKYLIVMFSENIKNDTNDILVDVFICKYVDSNIFICL